MSVRAESLRSFLNISGGTVPALLPEDLQIESGG